jgi:TetR/AcrR family transcriptional regulator, regulator of mycofactocin system
LAGSAPSLRDRKKQRTRHELMAAAVRLFAERGFEETTVDDIAAAADVSPRTFFRYYPSKVDALFGDFEKRKARVERALAERPEDEPLLETVRRVVLEFAGEFFADPDLFATRVRLLLAHPVLLAHGLERMARLEDVIAEAVARELRLPETDIRPRLVGAVAIAAVRSTSATWAARGGRGDPRKIVNEGFDLIEQGLLRLSERDR